MRGSALCLLAFLVTSSAAWADVEGVGHPKKIVVRHHTAAPWIIFGAGWPIIVGGLFTELLSQPMTTDNCATCPPSPPTDSARAGQIAGWIGVGTGAAMVAFGLVWHFVERAGPVITVAPTVGRELSGLMLRATF